jgi:putative membrane protein
MSDTAFAKNADQGGMAEIKLGQLAEERGSSPAVTDFGERMITDHGKADDSLKSTASVDKITLPSQISARDEATYNRLSKLSGTAFDRAYARDMVRDHETDVALFQREAKDGKDAYVKTFASETLPTLQSHLKQAREMLQSVSKEASNKSATKQTS